MNFLDIKDLSETEQEVVIEKLSDPVVKRYLTQLARKDVEELLTLSITERDNDEVAKKHCLIQGKVSVYTTLLSIQASKKE